VGLERTVVPLIGSQQFGLVLKSAIFLFIISFGVVRRAPTSYRALWRIAWAERRCSSRVGSWACRCRS
jgi:hypothetical protein